MCAITLHWQDAAAGDQKQMLDQLSSSSGKVSELEAALQAANADKEAQQQQIVQMEAELSEQAVSALQIFIAESIDYDRRPHLSVGHRVCWQFAISRSRLQCD